MTRRLLIADDDPLMRTLISVSLSTMEHFKIVEAADGEEADRHLRQSPFDAAILDWQMPGKNGLQLVRKLRASGSHTPVLMVTAEARKPQVVEALAAGVSDYLIKPFDADTLRDKVRRLLNPLPATAKLAASSTVATSKAAH